MCKVHQYCGSWIFVMSDWYHHTFYLRFWNGFETLSLICRTIFALFDTCSDSFCPEGFFTQVWDAWFFPSICQSPWNEVCFTYLMRCVNVWWPPWRSRDLFQELSLECLMWRNFGGTAQVRNASSRKCGLFEVSQKGHKCAWSPMFQCASAKNSSTGI